MTPRAAISRVGSWCLAIMLAVSLLCFTGSMLLKQWNQTGPQTLKQIADTPVRLASALAGAFQPKVEVDSLVLHTLGQASLDSKLVVMTQPVHVAIEKSSQKRVCLGLIDLGTTHTRLIALGNRVQFIVPTDQITPDSYAFNPATRTLTLHVPEPRIDHSFVDVQSDPRQISTTTTVGFFRSDARSGATLRNLSRQELRSAVLATADTEPLREKARAHARKILEEKLLAPLRAHLRSDVQLQLTFSPHSTQPTQLAQATTEP